MDVAEPLSTTRLAEIAGVSPAEFRSVMTLAGFIALEGNNYIITPDGERAGGTYKPGRNGQYIVFPPSIVTDPRLKSAPAAYRVNSNATTSASKIAEQYGCGAAKINALLAQLGWIRRGIRGWVVTPQGETRGGVQRDNTKTGETYALWPAAILTDVILKRAIDQAAGITDAAPPAGETAASIRARREPTTSIAADVPESFHREVKLFSIANDCHIRDVIIDALLNHLQPNAIHHHCTDGHGARCPAMAIVDNWLYTAGIVHAANHRLATEQETFVDLYIPADRLCLLFAESNAQADAVARRRQLVSDLLEAGYKAHLVEDSDLLIPDEGIPRMLAKLGAESLSNSLL